ncbi:MAG: PEP/pyruvate-binding domain-containing protein, partial [Candidatus Gracilibacteria bacterium]
SHRIIDLAQVYREDEDSVGRKAYELGMLWKLGIPLPDGFVITAEFFKEFLRLTGIDKEIKKIQSLSHPSISDSVKKLFQPIQKQIIQQYIPQALSLEFHKFYRELSGIFKDQSLNVFSSSSNNKSIVFQNVKGDANLVLKIKTIWSLSLEEPVSIVVQRNIKSDIRGKISTDNPTIDIDKKLAEKFKSKLIDYCKIIQKHFYFPYEIEYVVKKGKIFITKVNPFAGIINESPKQIPNNKTRKILAKGISINHGIVTGPVRIFRNIHSPIEVKKGEIIVLPCLNPSIFKKIKNAKAVIIDTISLNSLNKTLYRKNFQIPTVEGAKNATRMFQDGNVITVNGVSGEIYSGGLIYGYN